MCIRDSLVSDQWHSVAGHKIILLRCHRSLTLGPTLVLVYCDVERDRPQADGDEPAGDWVTSQDSVHNVFVNKKSNAMLMFILFSTEENLVSFLCCCFAKVLPSQFTESKDVPSVPVHFMCWSMSFPAALSVFVNIPYAYDDVVSSTNLWWCTSSIL